MGFSSMYGSHDSLIDSEENMIFFEVKYLNVAEVTPKYLKYQWFMMNEKSDSIIKLIFDKIEGTKRYFKNNITLDVATMIATIDDNQIQLSLISTSTKEKILKKIMLQ
jgi:hypothetical protein